MRIGNQRNRQGFHQARTRRGPFWKWRYRAYLVDVDAYALAALRFLDRHPVRAGLEL